MNGEALRELLREVKAAAFEGLGHVRTGTVVVRFSGGGDPDARPVAPGQDPSPMQGGVGERPWVESLELSFGSGSDAGVPAGLPKAPPAGAGVPAPGSVVEVAEGGNEGTLRRRLELVLGGKPGFHSGARAEVLADLLREFGRARLVEVLEREWISQFDTGPDASGSVSKVGGGSSTE